MKKHILLSVLFLTGLVAFAQNKDCQKFKHGTYTLNVESEKCILILKGNKQIEKCDGIKYIFDLKWTNDCTYTLTPNKKTIAKYDSFKSHNKVIVEILSTKASSYQARVTSNFDDKVLYTEIYKLK